MICPFWSGTPYEMLIIPRQHEAHLPGSDPSDLAAVGRAIRDALAALREHVGDIAYNLVFHTAPHRHDGLFHWHVHLWPKLVTVAGFERGTGVLINIVAPENGAQELRSAPRTATSLFDRHRGRRRNRRAAERRVGERRAASRTTSTWMTDAAGIRFEDDRRRGVGHADDRRHQGGTAASQRPHGDHRVGRRVDDGGAPPRARHRPRPLHARGGRPVGDTVRVDRDTSLPVVDGRPAGGAIGGRVSSPQVWRATCGLKALVEEGQRSVDGERPAPVDGDGQPTDQDAQA